LSTSCRLQTRQWDDDAGEGQAKPRLLAAVTPQSHGLRLQRMAFIALRAPPGPSQISVHRCGGVAAAAVLSIALAACGTAQSAPTTSFDSATREVTAPSLLSASPTPTTRSSSTASASDAPNPSWTRVTLPGEGSGWDTVAAAARGRERLLALGWHYEPNPHVGYNGGPRLWTSADGVAWESIRAPTEFQSLGPSGSLVAAPNGDFLLLGNSYDANNVLRPLVMSSADGVSWHAEPVDLPSQLYVARAVAGPKGYLLAGRQDDGSGGLWLSSDGLAWHRVHTLTQTDTTYEVITDIGAGDDGFVAVGVTGVPNGESTYFALASGDGRAWIRSEDPFSTNDGHADVAVVAPIGGDWVATGGWGGTLGRFWRSADGLHWEPAGVLEEAPSGSGPILVSAGGQLFFSFWDVPVGQPGGWTSTDGGAWTSLGLGPDGVLAGAFHDDRGLLLLGSTVVTEDQADATFWRP
jgi:hypothetical protein